MEKTIAEVGAVQSDHAKKLVASAEQEKQILLEFLPKQASQARRKKEGLAFLM